MKIKGAVVVVTGAAGGIGRALAMAAAEAGAARVVVSDRAHGRGDLAETAALVGGTAITADLLADGVVAALVERVQRELGPVGLFCSNAGVLDRDPDPDDPASAPDQAWERSWRVNVMAHVHAARALWPFYTARGQGWFFQTVSAAGLLSQIGAAPYSTTKHAALGFAENLAIAGWARGIGVSALCPQAVDTPMGAARMMGADGDGVLSAADVARAGIEGVERGDFLILPHPRVRDYVANRTADHDRWVAGMAKLRERVL